LGCGGYCGARIRTTEGQTQFIKRITGADTPGKPLEERVAEALGPKVAKSWHAALIDLITILGDNDAAYDSITDVNDEQLKAMRRNWKRGTSPRELRKRIVDLRLTYDWPALKSVVSICPGSATSRFKLNDLFNLLDMHIPPGFGVRAPVRPASSTLKKQSEQFFDARRLIGARNALLMILIASFYIDYQACISTKQKVLGQYAEFAKVLGRRMQRQGLTLSKGHLDQPAFYQGDVGFVSLNYDPIAVWLQFLANRELNGSKRVPRIGPQRVPLHLFHDFGHLIPARRIGKPDDDWPWYPLNEGAAQRLNEIRRGGDCRVRLTKFLFPHGCLCWRECPDCGKLSAFHGDEWKLNAKGLFPPPPLRAFDKGACRNWITSDELTQRKRGKVDARKCLHCGTLTYAHHTQAVMQSSYKPRPPSFIEEIQRDLRATTMRANHIIFMGYSLPPDDVTYRAFFSARRQRRGTEKVYCTVVDWDPCNPDWYGPAALKTRTFCEASPVNAARDIFGNENVRFYGGGVPNVFLDKGKATARTTGSAAYLALYLLALPAGIRPWSTRLCPIASFMGHDIVGSHDRRSQRYRSCPRSLPERRPPVYQRDSASYHRGGNSVCRRANSRNHQWIG
jgi:hypothetical protein